MEGEINGSYFINVMNAMLSSEFLFPELAKKVSELKEDSWYPLQMFSDMLFEIADKMPPVVMVNIGRKILLASKETLFKFGFDTLEKLCKDIGLTLTGIVRKVKKSKIQKTLHFSSKNAKFAYSVILPIPYVEGLIRGSAGVYKIGITKIEVKEGEEYNEFMVEWV